MSQRTNAHMNNDLAATMDHVTYNNWAVQFLESAVRNNSNGEGKVTMQASDIWTLLAVIHTRKKERIEQQLLTRAAIDRRTYSDEEN